MAQEVGGSSPLGHPKKTQTGRGVFACVPFSLGGGRPVLLPAATGGLGGHRLDGGASSDLLGGPRQAISRSPARQGTLAAAPMVARVPVAAPPTFLSRPAGQSLTWFIYARRPMSASGDPASRAGCAMLTPLDRPCRRSPSG